MTHQDKSDENPKGSILDVADGELCRTILDGMDKAVMFCDRRGRILYMNAAAEKLFGLSLGEVKGKPCNDVLPCQQIGPKTPEDGCLQVSELPFWRPGTSQRSFRLLRMDGTALELRASLTSLRKGDEDIGSVIVVEDITHAKLVERTYINTIEALGKSERRYRLLFDSAPDGICIMDTEGNIVECNLSESNLYGRPIYELVGRSIFDLVDEESEDTLKAAFEKAKTMELAEGEFTITRPDGHRVIVWHKWIPLSGRDKEFDGILSYDRDITDYKKMELYMLQTERLTAMGRLAAALAHEINNPLQAIASSLELVLDFPLDEEERAEYLKAIRSEIERLTKITSRVLEFARPPHFELKPTDLAEAVHYALSLAGKRYHVVSGAQGKSKPELADVAETVHYVLTLAGKQLEHSRIRVTTSLPESLPQVLASRDHLAQVFLNIILNAMEAMPEGGELRINAKSLDGQVEVTFTDTGPGIPQDALDFIFDPFYTTKEGGTGLGLSISHRIIQMHNGTISADNSPDGGAVITVTLPIASESEEGQIEDG